MNTRLIIIFIFCVVFGACRTQKQNRPNGWYHIANGMADSVAAEPIVTVKDFAELRLDSARFDGSTLPMYQIVGNIAETKQKLWADQTELAIGRSIGFMYEGEVICNPFLHGRIEGGNFAISFPPATDSGQKIKKIYQSLCREAGLAD